MNTRLALTIAGGILIVGGGFLSLVVERIIHSRVRDSVILDTNAEFDTMLATVRRTRWMHLWNITNLADVLHRSAKPKFQQLSYKLRYVEKNYESTWDNGRMSVEYKSWWRYDPYDEYTAAQMNQSVVQLNAVWLGVIALLGGGSTEMSLNYALSHVAIAQLVRDLDDYVSQVRKSSIPIYLERTGRETPFATSIAYSAAWRRAVFDDDEVARAELQDMHNFNAIVEWMQALVDSPEYIRVVAGVDSWEAARGAQFGNSTVSRTQDGTMSINPMLPVEMCVISGVRLTIEQAHAFLDTFANQTHSSRLIEALATSDLRVLDELAHTGLSLSHFADFIHFLFEYAPRTYFIESKLIGQRRSDGTGYYNSGLFTRRTAREFLFGYHDPLFDYYSDSGALSYNGMIGFQYDSIEDQARANPPLIYRTATGKRRLKKVGTYELWRNTTTIVERPDIPLQSGNTYDCSNLQSFESCRVWLEPVEMTGLPYRQVPPFRERKRKKTYAMWVAELLRPVTLSYDSETTIKGIHGRKYVPAPENFYTANCSLSWSCNPANANYRMWGPSFHAPMATVQGGYPTSMTKPALGEMDEKYRTYLYDGLPDYDEANMGTYVVIEPLTGFFIGGRKRLQYCTDLTYESLGVYWPQLFHRSPVLHFPVVWFDEGYNIDNKDAKLFKFSVYATRLQAKVWTILLVLIGIIILGFSVSLSETKTIVETMRFAPPSRLYSWGFRKRNKDPVFAKPAVAPQSSDLRETSSLHSIVVDTPVTTGHV